MCVSFSSFLKCRAINRSQRAAAGAAVLLQGRWRKQKSSCCWWAEKTKCWRSRCVFGLFFKVSGEYVRLAVQLELGPGCCSTVPAQRSHAGAIPCRSLPFREGADSASLSRLLQTFIPAGNDIHIKICFWGHFPFVTSETAQSVLLVVDSRCIYKRLEASLLLSRHPLFVMGGMAQYWINLHLCGN